MRRRWCARDGCEELQVAVHLRQISAHVQSGNITDSTGLAGVGDVTCPSIATRERRQDQAMRR